MLSVHRSGFCPSEACMHQFISIIHNSYNAFDANPSLEVRDVFLDISKTFDRVWHNGLLYKVKCMGINENFQNLGKSFLSNRCQHVVLNGEASSWTDVKVGVSQGSTLSSLFFLFTSMIGLILDKKLTFNDHIGSKLTTVNKLTITLRKIYRYISSNSLVTIYKCFVRMCLAYADVIFDKPSNADFSNEIKPAQHNAALARAGTIRGAFKEKLYQEFGFETIKERGFPRLYCFYKTLDNQALTTKHLYGLFPPPNRYYNTKNVSKIRQIFCRTETISNSFLPRKLENGTNLIFCVSSSFMFSYFAEHFWTLSDQLQVALLEQMLFLV